jgi:hypothetical protein
MHESPVACLIVWSPIQDARHSPARSGKRRAARPRSTVSAAVARGGSAVCAPRRASHPDRNNGVRASLSECHDVRWTRAPRSHLSVCRSGRAVLSSLPCTSDRHWGTPGERRSRVAARAPQPVSQRTAQRRAPFAVSSGEACPQDPVSHGMSRPGLSRRRAAAMMLGAHEGGPVHPVLRRPVLLELPGRIGWQIPAESPLYPRRVCSIVRTAGRTDR